jgi:hypothetical protein
MKPLTVVSTVIISGVAIFGVGYYALTYYGFFAPRMENVRRNVFENTRSYNDGMIQELQKYYLEYQKADNNGKESIRLVIQHQYAGYPIERLPAHLQAFVNPILNPTTF